MLYVNDPEKCAKFWSEQVGFIVKEEGEGRQRLLDKGVIVGEVVDMGNAEICNFADLEGHYFAFKSVKA